MTTPDPDVDTIRQALAELPELCELLPAAVGALPTLAIGALFGGLSCGFSRLELHQSSRQICHCRQKRHDQGN